MSDPQQSLHLDAESLRPGDSTYMPTSEWYARCFASVLHDPESESVICLCGLDQKEWPDRHETSDGSFVSYLPRVEWLAPWSTRGSDAVVTAEGIAEQQDRLGGDLPTHDALGVGGLPGITTDAHGVGASLDADGTIGVDDTSEISEEVGVHNAVLTSGGEDIAPVYRDDWLEVYGGDCRAVLAGLASESVHCVVTSPP